MRWGLGTSAHVHFCWTGPPFLRTWSLIQAVLSVCSTRWLPLSCAPVGMWVQVGMCPHAELCQWAVGIAEGLYRPCEYPWARGSAVVKSRFKCLLGLRGQPSPGFALVHLADPLQSSLLWCSHRMLEMQRASVCIFPPNWIFCCRLRTQSQEPSGLSWVATNCDDHGKLFGQLQFFCEFYINYKMKNNNIPSS